MDWIWICFLGLMDLHLLDGVGKKIKWGYFVSCSNQVLSTMDQGLVETKLDLVSKVSKAMGFM